MRLNYLQMSGHVWWQSDRTYHGLNVTMGQSATVKTSRPSRRAVFTEYPTDETGQEDHDMVVVTQQVLDPAILIILCNMFNNNL